MTLYSIQPGARLTIQSANRYSTVSNPDYLSFVQSDFVKVEGTQLHFRYNNVDYFAHQEDVRVI